MKSKNLHVGRHWKLWIPPLIWAAMIFGFSSVPGAAYPQAGFPAADKLVHIFLYGVLAGLCARPLARLAAARARGMSGPALVLTAAALATFYGATDELHQRWVPGRSSDLEDLVADAAGAVAGALVAALVLRRRRDSHGGGRSG
jgi:VanZ family protein